MFEYWALANALNMREKDKADKSEANRKVSWPVKCIADTEDTKDDLKKDGLQKKVDKLIRLGANKNV